MNADMMSEQAADDEVFGEPSFVNYDTSSESDLEGK